MTCYHFSRLESVDPDLAFLVWKVSQVRDIDVMAGARTLEDEERAIVHGFSHLKDARRSKHVLVPGIRDAAEAVDLAPHPVNWSDIQGFRDLALVVKQTALELDFPLVWSGDWPTPYEWGHFERAA